MKHHVDESMVSQNALAGCYLSLNVSHTCAISKELQQINDVGGDRYNIVVHNPSSLDTEDAGMIGSTSS
jgi:hypothetical protein